MKANSWLKYGLSAFLIPTIFLLFEGISKWTILLLVLIIFLYVFIYHQLLMVEIKKEIKKCSEDIDDSLIKTVKKYNISRISGFVIFGMLIGLFFFAFFPRSNNLLRKNYFPKQAFVETKLLINENFNSQIDQNTWVSNCDEGLINETKGELNISMKLNNTEGWKSCKLIPIVQQNLVRKLSLSASLSSETNNKGWIGIYSSCGTKYLNFMMNTEGVFIDHEELGRILLEEFKNAYTSHNERKLEIEYLIDKWVFSVYKSGFSDPTTREISCKDGLTYSAVGSGTNPGGFVTGSIDNVEIWVIED
jgi:hypothetical protein